MSDDKSVFEAEAWTLFYWLGLGHSASPTGTSTEATVNGVSLVSTLITGTAFILFTVRLKFIINVTDNATCIGRFKLYFGYDSSGSLMISPYPVWLRIPDTTDKESRHQRVSTRNDRHYFSS